MRVDDFICLGRTVPEESKKYGQRVCMAGVSAELGSLMRVYPLPIVNPVRMRGMYSMELERNTGDSRRESWKLKDRFAIAPTTDRPIAYHDLRDAVKRNIGGTLAQFNHNRTSLGIIKPKGIECCFETRKGVTSSLQGTLWEDLDCHFGANAIDLIPRIRFYDDDGHHDLQLREWGCYEFIRKHREKAGELWNVLGIGDESKDLHLVVGNMCHQRNVWLVISVLKFARNLNNQLHLSLISSAKHDRR